MSEKPEKGIKIGVEALDQQVSVEDGRIKGKLKAFGVGLDVEAPVPFLGAMRRFMHSVLEPLREKRAHRALQHLSEAVIVWGTAYAVQALPPDRPKFAAEIGYDGASLTRLHDRLAHLDLLPDEALPFDGARLHDAALLMLTSLRGDDVDQAVDVDTPPLHEFVTLVDAHRLDDLALARLTRDAHRAISTWQAGLKATRNEDDPQWHRAAAAMRHLGRLGQRLPTGPDGQRSAWDRATGPFADDLDLAPSLNPDHLRAPEALEQLVQTVRPQSTVFHEDIGHLAALLEKLGLDHPSMDHQRVGRAHRIPETFYRQYGAELLFVAACNNWGDVIARAHREFQIGPDLTSRAGGNAVTYAVKRGAYDALAAFAEVPGLIDNAPYQQWGNVYHGIASTDASPEDAVLMARWARGHSQADPDAPDATQQTPLLLAIKGGMLGVAELLLEWGANPNAVAPNGATALELLNALPPDGPDSPVAKVRQRLQRNLTSEGDPVIQAFNRLKMEEHLQGATLRAILAPRHQALAERFDRARANPALAPASPPVRSFAWAQPVTVKHRVPSLREIGARLPPVLVSVAPGPDARSDVEGVGPPVDGTARPAVLRSWARQA